MDDALFLGLSQLGLHLSWLQMTVMFICIVLYLQ